MMMMRLLLSKWCLQPAIVLQRGTENFFSCVREQMRISLHWQKLDLGFHTKLAQQSDGRSGLWDYLGGFD